MFLVGNAGGKVDFFSIRRGFQTGRVAGSRGVVLGRPRYAPELGDFIHDRQRWRHHRKEPQLRLQLAS